MQLVLYGDDNSDTADLYSAIKHTQGESDVAARAIRASAVKQVVFLKRELDGVHISWSDCAYALRYPQDYPAPRHYREVLT